MTAATNLRAVAVLTIAVAGLSKPTIAALAPPPQAENLGLSPAEAREYPSFDDTASGLVSRGLAAKALRRRLTDRPDDPDLPRLLANQNRLVESLEHLRRIVERQPDQIARAFGTLQTLAFITDASLPHAQALRDIVVRAKEQVSTLSREEAAKATRVLLAVESGLNRQGGARNSWEATLTAFVRDYAGTETALMTEVDVINARPLNAGRLAALDEFAARHQGTCAAAKALHQKGFDLAYNASALRMGPVSGADPTVRFQQVVEIARQLETGGYGACEWVDKAPALISGFSAYQPKFSRPENIDVMLAEYRAFVRKHFALDEPNAVGSTVAFVIAKRMGDLFELKGDRVAGIEGVLSELEQSAKVRAAAQSLRAAYYLGTLANNPADRPAMVSKAIATLQAIHAGASVPYARRALSTLASLLYHERDYGRAREAYGLYLKQDPSSAWSWVAALRFGQTSVELNDLDGALSAFRLAATVSAAAIAPGKVLAHAYAADVLAALGRPGEAAQSAELALAGWDDDFGARYSIRGNQARLPGDEPFAILDDAAVAKEQLPRRIDELRRSATSPAGSALEQGRWFMARGRLDDARAALARAASEGRGTALGAAALALSYRASLEYALRLTDVQNPKRDEAAAMRELDRLAAEPLDFAVVAAAMAQATLRSQQGQAADADAVMTTALERWKSGQPVNPAAPAPNSVAADVAAIRAEIVRPLGGGVYSGKAWNAFTWPNQLPRFVVINPDVAVKLSTGEATTVALRHPLPGLNNVLFLNADDLGLLTSMMRALGGTARGQPARVMDTPNQPIGPSLDVRAFWNRYFPTRPGHWSGWEFETYPTITDVTFHNAERTRAAVRVTVGYSGCTAVLVKENGAWRATELVNCWVT